MKHPTSGEQLHFYRREYRADPIERPVEPNGDLFVAAAAIGGALGALLVWIMERLP